MLLYIYIYVYKHGIIYRHFNDIGVERVGEGREKSRRTLISSRRTLISVNDQAQPITWGKFRRCCCTKLGE